jgi:hypothetical protein
MDGPRCGPSNHDLRVKVGFLSHATMPHPQAPLRGLALTVNVLAPRAGTGFHFVLAPIFLKPPVSSPVGPPPPAERRFVA